jgi:hypothetical protein
MTCSREQGTRSRGRERKRELVTKSYSRSRKVSQKGRDTDRIASPILCLLDASEGEALIFFHKPTRQTQGLTLRSGRRPDVQQIRDGGATLAARWARSRRARGLRMVPSRREPSGVKPGASLEYLGGRNPERASPEPSVAVVARWQRG